MENENEKINVELEFLPKQWELFNDDARFKVIAKGRRFGLTKGFSLYAISKCLGEVDYSMLWVDTIYGNINRYYERYFLPELKKINHLCAYKRQDNILKINESYIDFRSADRPENIEGQSYKTIILNEAGIILKDRRLWTESILPMVMDHKANVLIGGTPKGKWVKGKEKHLFYELYQRGEITKNKNQMTKGEITKDKNQMTKGEITKDKNQMTKGESERLNVKDQNLNEGENRWKSYNYSTYENPLLDEAEIKEVENEIPYFLRQQEIHGKFIEENEAQIIRHEWWKYYPVESIKYKVESGIERIVQSWDTAFKTKEENDFSVCTTWGITRNKFLLLDMFRARMEFPELKRKAAELFTQFKPSVVLIEDKASGQSLIQELERETRIPIKKIKVDKDKYSRFIAITPLIEAGKIALPEGESFTEEFINEMEEFPNGEFDDVVDSASQFLNEYKTDGMRKMEFRTVNMKNLLKIRN